MNWQQWLDDVWVEYNFTGILLEDEYHLPEVSVSCAEENENADTTEETEETKD